MRLFTSHQRSPGLFDEPDVILVEEGFCWSAFFFTALWALWHRMWVAAIAIAAGIIAMRAAGHLLGLHPVSRLALLLGTMLFIGFHANDWRRRWLERRGYFDGPIVAGRDRGAAELRLITRERRADAA